MSEIYNKNWNRERVRAGMRWFGPDDAVTIQHIRQTPGVTNVISALHHIPAGDVWTEAEVAKRKIEVEYLPVDNAPEELNGMPLFQWYQANAAPTGLIWDTAESLIFTEDIKNGSPTATNISPTITKACATRPLRRRERGGQLYAGRRLDPHRNCQPVRRLKMP